MLKYFVAEGIMSNHSVLLAGADPSPQLILQELPGVIEDEPTADKLQSSDESMKIAWRYQNKAQVQTSTESSSAVKFGHYYDLTKTMPEEKIQASRVHCFNPMESQSESNELKENSTLTSYSELLTTIHNSIIEGHFKTSETQQNQQRNILRIGVHSLGSPLWGSEGCSQSTNDGVDFSLPSFLYALRSLMRSAFAVCLITIPSHLFQDSSFTKKLEHLADTVVHLDSFVGSSKEKNPAFKEYHGLFNIVKLPRLNSMVQHMPDTLDLAFKLKRKKFMIERLHLPPELSETASRDQEAAASVMPQSGCSSGMDLVN